MSEPKNKNVIKEFGGFNGDFLTLAPPRAELPSSYISHQCQKVPDFDALPYQVRHRNSKFVKGSTCFFFQLTAMKFGYMYLYNLLKYCFLSPMIGCFRVECFVSIL